MVVAAALGALLIALTKALILALVVPIAIVAGHIAWDCIKPVNR